MGSLCPQPVCSHHQVPNGNHNVSHSSDPARRLDDLHRSQESLLSGSSTPVQPPIPAILLDDTALPVQGSLLRPLNSSTGFHVDDGSSFSGFLRQGVSPPPLLRRLASLAASEREAYVATSFFFSLCLKLEIQFCGKKSSLTPSHTRPFGDGDSLSPPLKVLPTTPRLTNLQSRLKSFLSNLCRP